MQATTRFHDSISNAILQEANCILHDPLPFHTTTGMFNPDSAGREATMRRVLRRGEFTPTGFLLRLNHRHRRPQEALESQILLEATARWPRITRQIRHALLVRHAFTGTTQDAHVTSLMDPEEVFDRVALLLAALVVLLVLRVFRTLDRAFGPLMHNRGDAEGAAVERVARIAATSAAVRTGRRSWSARA